MRNGPAHPRALLIANGTYPAAPLPGALKDADDLAKTLASPESWALDKDHLAVKKNLAATAMEQAIKDFFHNAAKDETLLFYYAGHGDSDGSEGFLIPIDDKPKPPHRRISASSLWG